MIYNLYYWCMHGWECKQACVKVKERNSVVTSIRGALCAKCPTPHSHSKVVTDYNVKIYQIIMNKNYILTQLLNTQVYNQGINLKIVLKCSFYSWLFDKS